jgi:hypothetical protein
VSAAADAGIEIRSDIVSGQLLAVTALMGAVGFTFAWGRINAYRGAFAIHRPSAAVCLESEYSTAGKVLALSWDHAQFARPTSSVFHSNAQHSRRTRLGVLPHIRICAVVRGMVARR